MDIFYTINISKCGGYSYDYDPDESVIQLRLISIFFVVTCIIITISLPLTVVAVCALCSLVRKDDVAPIYVINLLISDLIQFCCIIGELISSENLKINIILIFIHIYSLMVSVGFMVCIALERYLVIAWPLWYRFRRTIKTSVVVCILVWTLPLVISVTRFVVFYFTQQTQISSIIFGMLFLLLPLPLFIFFLVGTLKSLSAATSVPSDEKRRIVGILVLVLPLYTLLFLPTIILYLQKKSQHDFSLNYLSVTFALLNPLADSLLYVFTRKGMIDKLLTSVCCCKVDSDDSSISSV